MNDKQKTQLYIEIYNAEVEATNNNDKFVGYDWVDAKAKEVFENHMGKQVADNDYELVQFQQGYWRFFESMMD